jgi:hypothetical protein
MFFKEIFSIMRVVLAGVLATAICLSAFAQSQSGKPAKTAPSKTPPKKESAEKASCDGALDIVPAKAMTFIRKRRPGNNQQPGSGDAKPDKQQPGEKDRPR